MATGRWGDYAKSTGGQYVNKDDWAQREVAFYIKKVGVREAHGKFKAEWELTVEADGEESSIMTFSQGTGGRDEAIEAVAVSLENGEVTEVGPIMVVKVRTKRGNPFFALEEAEDGDDDTAAATFVAAGNTDIPKTQLPNQADDLPW